jgi:hypothetical protein
MSAEPPARETLFARLLCDVMIPAEFSAAIRAQGYDVAEARTFPSPCGDRLLEEPRYRASRLKPAAVHTGRRVFAGWVWRGQRGSWEGKETGERSVYSH